MNFLNSPVSPFFQFALAFIMLQVFNNYSDKHKKMNTKNESVTKKELRFIGKTHSLATCYSSNMLLSFSNTGLSLWIFSEDFMISTDCLTECLKDCTARFEANTRLIFWSSRNIESFLKSVLQKAYMHAYINLMETWNS